MSKTVNDYLFERMFLQAAHISILEEGLEQAKLDFQTLKQMIEPHRDEALIIEEAIKKIEIADKSIQKLKNGA